MKTRMQSKARLFHLTGAVMLALLLNLGLQAGLHSATVAAKDVVAETGTISGRVTASDGGELGPLVVVAFERSNQYHAESRLDATGLYTLTELPPGTYYISFNALREGPYLPEYFDNKESFIGGGHDYVTVTAGAITSGIDAELQAYGIIQGRVTSELTGEPLAGILAMAHSADSLFWVDSDANGIYTITGPIGIYRVEFRQQWGMLPEDYRSEYYADKLTMDAADPVTMTTGVTTTDIDAALTHLQKITGRIEDANSHEPMIYVRVAAYDAAGEQQGYAQRPDDTGYYTITGLMPGSYRIRFGQFIDDYPRHRYPEFVPMYYDNRVVFEEANWITITPGLDVHDIDAAVVRYTPIDIDLESAASRPRVFVSTSGPDFTPWYSLDGGKSWHQFSTVPFFSYRFSIPLIAVVPKDDPAHPVRFILASSSNNLYEPEGIYRTGDAGVSWSWFYPLDNAICSGDIVAVKSLVTSPIDPQRVYAVIACHKYCGELCERYDRSLYSSADGGVTWQATAAYNDSPDWLGYGYDDGVIWPSPIVPSPIEPSRVYARSGDWPDAQWLRSDNSGKTWVMESFTATILALDWTNPAKLHRMEETRNTYVFRYIGKRSTDSGATWTAWPQQPCRTSFRQLLTLPSEDTLLLLCDQGLYRSRNGGDAWEKVSTESGESLMVDAGDRAQVIWVRAGELWTSRDQGTTWSRLGNGHAGQHTFLRLPDVRRP